MAKSLLMTTVLFVTTSVAQATLTVQSVIAGGAAAAAGVQADDRLVLLDGQKIGNMDDLAQVTSVRKPGDRVPLVVERDGQKVELKLTFGARPDGGPSIGVRLAIEIDPEAEPTRGTRECRAWFEETYRVRAMAEEFGLDVSQTYDELIACARRDTQRMTSDRATKFCDNVFKVHCSGLDLLAEIGEAQVAKCETLVADTLGLKLNQYKGWKTCGQHKVFERYSNHGHSSNAQTCAAALLDECGTNIDAVIKSGRASAEQQSFADCCSASELNPHAPDGSPAACLMLEGSFKRGPCQEHPVCVNRLTSEWLSCEAQL